MSKVREEEFTWAEDTDEDEDAELKVSRSEMMSRGFTERKEIRQMWGSENTLADGFLRFPYKSVVWSQLVKCRNGSESVKHVPFVHLRPTICPQSTQSQRRWSRRRKIFLLNIQRWFLAQQHRDEIGLKSCSQSKMTLFFSSFFPISLTWPLSWRDYNFLRFSYLFHILITIVHFFVILHDLG